MVAHSALAFALALLASFAAAAERTARATVIISVSVAPRTWRADDGALCSNLPADRFGVVDGRGNRNMPHDPAGRCGAGAASRIDPVRADPGKILLIIPD